MADWRTQNLVPFGRYHLGARIASGGMGEVYLAKMKGAAGFEKRIIIKKILPHFSRDPDFVRRFIDEGKLVVKLSHGNIVPVLDLGEVDGEYFIAMDYVDGADLRQVEKRLVASGRRMPVELVLFVVKEVAKGLGYAHTRADEQGRPLHVIHRDVSPANIMVSRDGEVKVLDFGIAKAADRLSHSVAGTLKGKFLYMSPEQARGEAVDPRSDLFSLGSVAYELLTGTRPFEGDTDMQTLERVKAARPRPLRDLDPSIPEAVEAMVHTCLAADRKDRYASAEALQRDIVEYQLATKTKAGERELAAFVGEVLGPDPAALAASRSLDEALIAELASLDSDPLAATATQAAPPPVRRPDHETGTAGWPTPGSEAAGPGTGPGSGVGSVVVTQTQMATSNRLLVAGLLVIIGILLFFNILNILGRDDGPAAAAPTGDAIATATLPPAPPEDLLPGGEQEDAREAPAPAPAPDVRSAPTPPADASTSRPERTVRFRELPEDAVVHVDDAPVRLAEGGILRVPDDSEVVIEVRRPGYLPFELRLAKGEAPPDPVPVELRPVRRTVTVQSDPPGAELFVDGAAGGPTPVRVPVLHNRPVVVEARLAGYEDARQTLRYAGPPTVTLRLEEARRGRVSFRFFPANALVLLDGAPLDTGGSNRVDRELTAGKHVLVIRAADGSTEKRVPFEIQAGKTNRLGEFQLTAAP